MKTNKFYVCIVVGFIFLSAWTVHQTNDMKKAEWLIGTWENKTSRGSIFEMWNKSSDHEYLGKSFKVKENDTIVFENIRLVQEHGGLFYVPIVENQNDGLPIRFTAKTISETQLVFENPQHDFPQIISYTKIGKDSLVAEISGLKNGQKRQQTFPMKRVK